LEIDIREI
jgi:hypothetical protein